MITPHTTELGWQETVVWWERVKTYARDGERRKGGYTLGIDDMEGYIYCHPCERGLASRDPDVPNDVDATLIMTSFDIVREGQSLQCKGKAGMTIYADTRHSMDGYCELGAP